MKFAIRAVRSIEHAVQPSLAIELSIASDVTVHSAMLQCQIAIEPAARGYTDVERASLGELFGSGTPRSLLWTHASVVVPGFTTSTVVDLVLPCPIDFSHAATKYAAGVEGGALPIVVQLSGTSFHDRDGRLQVAPIPRDREARFAIPVDVWRATVRHYFPDRMPVPLRHDMIDRLHAYRSARGLPTIERALEELLRDR